MRRHKIAYIDENPDDILRFQSRVNETLDVIGLAPKPDLNEFVDELLKTDAEAFVADFRLNEYLAEIRYTGGQLIEKILGFRRGFPCFVLTSYDEDAVQHVEDVNYVYPKDILIPEKQPGQITLAEKIRFQIEHYQVAIERKTNKFHELLEKSESQELTDVEENELLDLDSFLESALNNHSALSPEKKSRLAVGKIDDLIASTNELLRMLKDQGE